LRLKVFFLGFLCISILFTPALAEVEQGGGEIVKKVDDIRAPVEPFGFTLDVLEFQKDPASNENKKKSETRLKISVRGSGEEVYRSLVKWTYPVAEKGKVMLMDGDVFWLYFAGTRNSIRISPAQRLAGLTTGADIASVNFQRDYKVISKAVEELDGEMCYRLRLKAKSDGVAYDSLELYANKETYRPLMCKYYALSGRLLKTAYYRDFKAALGQKRPHEIFIEDAVDKNHTTRMLYSEMELDKKPLFMFRKDYLPNIKD
jgi:outer membrane lipoprotein-sorting protein